MGRIQLIIVIALVGIGVFGVSYSLLLFADKDTPVITRIGPSQVTVQVGSTYVDTGATALDNVDGNITSKIVTVNPVNTNVTGTYAITYDLTNSRGHHAKQVTRIVNVIVSLDTTKMESENTTINASSTTHPGFDKWGIKELNPTITNGREWFNAWDNGIPRTIIVGNQDPFDPTGWFRVTGNGSGVETPKVYIDGKDVAIMSGHQPRMYIYDPSLRLKWQNTEVTVYGKRISETALESSQGINIGARSNHQDQGKPSNCGVDTYYSRMLYNGIGNFAKELNWPKDSKKPNSRLHLDWLTPYGSITMPRDVWIGHKFVIRNVDGGTHVRLEMWRDLTNGTNGGDWKLVLAYTDDGNWPAPATLDCHDTKLNRIILDQNPSVFIRNTDISSAQYKYFSIREIASLP